MRTLILGGTAQARALAAVLSGTCVEVISSLAGRTRNPELPEGELRTGGFGGADGLSAWLDEAGIDLVVDATHPFAARMSANAALACRAGGVELIRLERPSWGARPLAADWRWVDDHADALAVVRLLPGTVLLTVGRQRLGDYTGLTGRRVLARVADPPAEPLPAGWELLVERGPFTVEGELALFGSRSVSVLVSKDSGGEETAAKLDAAAVLGVEVVMIRRPPAPDGVPAFGSVPEVVSQVLSRVP